MSPPRATRAEVTASKRRKRNVESIHFDGGAVPPWVQQMQDQLQQHGTQMQQLLNIQQQSHESQLNMQQQTDDMQLRMGRMERQLLQESQRSMNRSRRYNKDPIEDLIRLDDGLRPTTGGATQIWFPADQNELSHTSDERLDALLHFYGLPNDDDGNRTQKEERLKRFLGVIM